MAKKGRNKVSFEPQLDSMKNVDSKADMSIFDKAKKKTNKNEIIKKTVILISRANHSIYLKLNNGDMLHLSPRERVKIDSELVDYDKLDSLVIVKK